MPASSHPSLAAAIALLPPHTARDVVWDPFVGAGAELVERAYLGPYAHLFGTDIDAKAVEAARTNVAAAGLGNVTIEQADAVAWARARRDPVHVILTNPPLGRRVRKVEGFLEAAAKVLVPGGTLVWTGGRPDRGTPLRLERAFRIDMGGFPADLAVYRKRV